MEQRWSVVNLEFRMMPMKIYGWFGLLLLLVSEYCLLHRIEPFFTWFYCFAWWVGVGILSVFIMRAIDRYTLVRFAGMAS
jgi:hypothetical protein